jgi:general secretion pathway protein A
MFLEFFGLREQPFGMTPDPAYLFWSHSHREALASVFYGIESGCGFITLIGAPGMGKTTLVFHMLERLRSSVRTAFLFQTQCTSLEFLRYLHADLGGEDGEFDLVRANTRLNEVLLEQARQGKRFVLVIDEAQNLEPPVLETIRLLSDFETPRRKLLQIVLVGQPELAKKLASPEMLQLRQRISVVGRLGRLSEAETAQYIVHRLHVAGRRDKLPFASGALALIFEESSGIPRSINILCFNSMTLGFAEQRRVITEETVREVIADLDMTSPPEGFRAAHTAPPRSFWPHISLNRW